MADKIIVSISYIKTISKRKRLLNKCWRICPNQKFVIRHGRLKVWKYYFLTWLLKAKLYLLVDSSYNVNQNEVQDDNDKEAQDDKDDNCNFVENTQIDRTSSVSDNLEANLGVRYTYSFTPGLCLPLSLVKLIFLYTCSTKVKSRPYPYFAPVLKAGVKLTPGVIQHDLNV